MKMKPCSDKQPSSEISCAPTSSQSRDDQVTSSNPMSINEDAALRNNGLLCIPHDFDLDPARMVIKNKKKLSP